MKEAWRFPDILFYTKCYVDEHRPFNDIIHVITSQTFLNLNIKQHIKFELDFRSLIYIWCRWWLHISPFISGWKGSCLNFTNWIHFEWETPRVEEVKQNLKFAFSIKIFFNLHNLAGWKRIFTNWFWVVTTWKVSSNQIHINRKPTRAIKQSQFIVLTY